MSNNKLVYRINEHRRRRRRCRAGRVRLLDRRIENVGTSRVREGERRKLERERESRLSSKRETWNSVWRLAVVWQKSRHGDFSAMFRNAPRFTVTGRRRGKGRYLPTTENSPLHGSGTFLFRESCVKLSPNPRACILHSWLFRLIIDLDCRFLHPQIESCENSAIISVQFILIRQVSVIKRR